MLKIYGMTCCRQIEPLYIAGTPLLSWKLESDRNNDRQTAYRITCGTAEGGANLWDSGKVSSDETLDIPYEGSPIPEFTRVQWSVTVWDSEGNESQSCVSSFETGPDYGANLGAGWIKTADVECPAPPPPMPDNFEDMVPGGDMPPMPERKNTPVSLARREFDVDGKPGRARVYITGSGANVVYINGCQSPLLCTPPETNISRRMLCMTHDVTDMLREGKNCIGIEFAAGIVSAVLAVTTEDGKLFLLNTDDSWQVRRESGVEIKPGECGEIHDGRRALQGWSRPGFDATDWEKAGPGESVTPYIQPAMLPNHMVVETLAPQNLHRTESGNWMFSLPVYNVGRVVLTGNLKAGTEVKIHCAERIDSNGRLVPEISGMMNEECGASTFIFGGTGTETYAQRFTYFGFRYCEIEGWPGELSAENIRVESVRADVRRVCDIETGEPIFERYHDNMLRTIENNLHGVITTTPVYEKNLTTADGTLASERMLTELDMLPVLRKSMTDIRDSQAENGGLGEGASGALCQPKILPEWSSFNVNLTRYITDYCGDKDVIRDYYEHNRAYAMFEIQHLRKNGWLSDSFFGGDWNSPEGEFSPEGGKITGSGYEILTMRLMSEFAESLGKAEDAAYFAEIADKVTDALNKAFLKDGYYETDQTKYFERIGGPPWNTDGQEPLETGYRQTSNILPLMLGIVPEEKKTAVLENLVRDIRENRDGHLHTGCIGTKFALAVLTENGYGELAYSLATEKTFPSWGWQVENGSTTFYEDWTLSPRSSCHFYLGSGITDWMFKYLAGIRNVRDGFRTMTIAPFFPEKLDKFGLRADTARGIVAVRWEKHENGCGIRTELPPGCSAELILPGKEPITVKSGVTEIMV